MARRFKPKEWPTVHRPDVDFLLTSADVIKDLYPLDWERPWWAKLAKTRHWMTLEEYYNLPDEFWVMCKNSLEYLYAESPMFKLIRKKDV